MEKIIMSPAGHLMVLASWSKAGKQFLSELGH